jgi:pimeloyl-ACP methyl ester carboxylesterase
MPIIDQGSGTPLVLIPGIQGRWGDLRPAVELLSRSFRVITFPLCGERTSDVPFDRARGLDNYVSQTVEALDHAGLREATVCGISFGGIVALRFAAAYPERTKALVLASTPGPTWQPCRRHQIYAQAPGLFAPLFVAETPWRLWAELASAFPDLDTRARFVRSQLRVLLDAPLSFKRMAERARMISRSNRVADCARVVAPTLVVTGEPALDRVVPVDSSVQYLRLIRDSRAVVLERTGHLGAITRPDAFAAVVRDFVDADHPAAA